VLLLYATSVQAGKPRSPDQGGPQFEKGSDSVLRVVPWGPSRLLGCVKRIKAASGLTSRLPKHRSEGREPENWSAGRQWSGHHWVKSSEGHWLVAGGGWVVREKKNGQTEGKRKKKGHKKDTKEKR